MKKVDEIVIFGELESQETFEQIKTCAKDAYKACLMADHHLGYSMPIGGVVAYENKISPSGVGFDIACGNKAVLLDVPASEVKTNIKKIMDDIYSQISFGVGRNNDEPVEHPMFEKNGDPAWDIPEILELKRKALNQLGTIGSGNHYVDIFEDELNRIWVGCHFGSRGLGHSIATHFLKAGGKDAIMAEPTVFDVNSDLGAQYILGMNLAGRYAYAGRVMGRMEAAGKKKWMRVKEGERKQQVVVREGKISRQMMMDWITPMGVELRGAGTDESPHCYKRLPEVLKAQGATIELEHILTPLGVAMAGADEFDPYKD